MGSCLSIEDQIEEEIAGPLKKLGGDIHDLRRLIGKVKEDSDESNARYYRKAYDDKVTLEKRMNDIETAVRVIQAKLHDNNSITYAAYP